MVLRILVVWGGFERVVSRSRGGFVVLIELLPEGGHLAALEPGDPERSPTLGGAGHGAEHQFQNRLLAERVGDDLQAPALLDEQALQQIRRRSRRPPVADRQPEMGDAGLEVLHEAGDRVGQIAAVVGDDALRELARDLPPGRPRWRGP
jgi:hypothetical protein